MTQKGKIYTIIIKLRNQINAAQGKRAYHNIKTYVNTPMFNSYISKRSVKQLVREMNAARKMLAKVEGHDRISYSEMCDIFYKHNEENNISSQYSDKNPIYGVIVYSEKNWKESYSLESRSYVVQNDEKRFVPGLGGNSMFGTNLDKTDHCVRLDHTGWDIDYCYISETNPLKADK